MSCLALLYAASASTLWIDRLPSLSVLLGQVLVGRSNGTLSATASDLRRWAGSLRSAIPEIAQYERVQPLLAGPLVHVYWQGAMWPLHAGRSPDPEAVVEQVRRYAQVADERLIPWLGFGISDVAEVAFRIMALHRRFANPYWDDPSDDGPSAVEVDDTGAYLRELLGDLPDGQFPSWLSDGFPDHRLDALRAAAAWCTRDAEDLAQGQWLLGDALLVRTDLGVLPVPAGFALHALESLAERLLVMAKQAPGFAGAPTVADGLRRRTEARFATSARGLSTSLIGPVEAGQSGRISCLMFPAARRLIAVQIVAGTDPQDTAREVDRAKRRLRWIKPGAVISVDAPSGEQMPSFDDAPFVWVGPGHQLRIADDAVIRRVILVDGPWKPRPESRRGAVVLGLDSWCRITAGLMDDHEEFWAFLDEIADMPGPRRVYGVTAADLWEAFRANGVLPLDEADWPLVGGPAERWEQRSAVDDHEIVLRQLGLPGLQDWPFVSTLINGCVTVGATTPYEHTTVTVEPALALHVTGDAVEERQWMMILENAIRGGLMLLAEARGGPRAAAWQAWQAAAQQPLRVTFVPVPPSASPEGIKLALASGDHLTIAFAVEVLNRTDPPQIHALVGEALWSYLVGMLAVVRGGPDQQLVNVGEVLRSNDSARRVGEDFLSGWSELPVTSMFVRTSTERDVAPRGVAARITDGGIARARREITERVLASGTTIGELTERHDIRKRVMIPAALAVLQEHVARVHAATALPVIATAVERLQADRTRTDHDRVLRRAVGWHELDDVETVALGNVIASRTADMLLEALVAAAPGGTQRMDQRDWSTLLHLGAVLLELSGEQAQYDAGIISTADLDRSGRSVPFDAQAYLINSRRHHDRQIAHGFNSPEREIVTTQLRGTGDRAYLSWTAIVADQRASAKTGSPEWQTATAALEANEALKAELGIGIDDVLAVLIAAADPPEREEIIRIPAQALVDRVHARSHLDPRSIRLAINLLTLTPEEVRREGLNIGRIEDRGARLALRPLLPDLGAHESLILMPRRIGTSARLILGYISAARPPWPNLSTTTTRAFQNWAQKQQKQFEIDGEVRATTTNLKVIRGLKPERAKKNEFTISGEIDLLVIDEHGHRIWVIEAKAGHMAIDAGRLLHDIIDFHGIPESEHPRWERYRAKKRPYVPTLLAKASDIQTYADALLAMAGIERGDATWSVQPLMVTPSPVPAAYVPDPRVPFATLDDLVAVLQNPATPAPGPQPTVPVDSEQ